MNISIPKKLRGDHAIVYTYLKMKSVIPYEDDYIYIHVSELAALLGGCAKHTLRKIKDSIDYLFDDSTIEGELISRGLYKLKRDTFYKPIKSWTNVPFSYLHKIIKETDSWALANYYIILVGTIDVESSVGIYGINKLCELSGLHYKTVLSYNKQLEDLGVIFIIHNHMNNGDSNRYGLPENEGAVRRSVQFRIAKDSANFHRSVSAKYNRFITTDGAGWTEDEVRGLLSVCTQYNEQMDALQTTQPGTDYINRKKNLAPIEEYLLTTYN